MFNLIKLIYIKINNISLFYIKKLYNSMVLLFKYKGKQSKLDATLYNNNNGVSSVKDLFKRFIKHYYIPLIMFNKLLNLITNIYNIFIYNINIFILYITEEDKKDIKYKILTNIIEERKLKINNEQLDKLWELIKQIPDKNQETIILKINNILDLITKLDHTIDPKLIWCFITLLVTSIALFIIYKYIINNIINPGNPGNPIFPINLINPENLINEMNLAKPIISDSQKLSEDKEDKKDPEGKDKDKEDKKDPEGKDPEGKDKDKEDKDPEGPKDPESPKDPERPKDPESPEDPEGKDKDPERPKDPEGPKDPERPEDPSSLSELTEKLPTNLKIDDINILISQQQELSSLYKNLIKFFYHIKQKNEIKRKYVIDYINNYLSNNAKHPENLDIDDINALKNLSDLYIKMKSLPVIDELNYITLCNSYYDILTNYSEIKESKGYYIISNNIIIRQWYGDLNKNGPNDYYNINDYYKLNDYYKPRYYKHDDNKSDLIMTLQDQMLFRNIITLFILLKTFYIFLKEKKKKN